MDVSDPRGLDPEVNAMDLCAIVNKIACAKPVHNHVSNAEGLRCNGSPGRSSH